MRIIRLIMFFAAFVILTATNSHIISAEPKTDFKTSASVIAVADPDFKEYSYIDMGTANGVKAGDRFMVQGKYGKVMVEVVQSFQRMSSVRIVDSWLLGEGNSSEIVPASRYPKIRVAKYVERKKDFRPAPKKTAKKQSSDKPATAKPKAAAKAEKKAPVPEPAIPALPGEEPADDLMPGMDADAGVPVGEPDTALPGEETLPMEPEGDLTMPADDLQTPAADPGLPADDMGAMPADDMGLPADDMGAMPADDMGLPADDMGAMPGDALPPLP